jgi:hypothetical protein
MLMPLSDWSSKSWQVLECSVETAGRFHNRQDVSHVDFTTTMCNDPGTDATPVHHSVPEESWSASVSFASRQTARGFSGEMAERSKLTPYISN